MSLDEPSTDEGESKCVFIIFFLLISGFTYLLYIFEFRFIDLINESNEKISSTIFLKDFDKYDSKLNNRFVVLQDIEPKYNPITDKEFSITANGAVLTRQYFFCQWKQSRRHRHYYYQLRWSKKQIDSSKFRTKKYQNPNQILRQSFQTAFSSLGIYSIQPSFFRSPSFLTPFVPDDSQIESFKTSQAYLSTTGAYRYITNGVFYRPYKKKRLKLLDSKPNLTSSDINNCDAGDIILKFQVSHPSRVSIGAVLHNRTLIDYKDPKTQKELSYIYLGNKTHINDEERRIKILKIIRPLFFLLIIIFPIVFSLFISTVFRVIVLGINCFILVYTSYTHEGFYLPPILAKLILLIYGCYLCIEFLIWIILFFIDKKQQNHIKED